MLRSKAVVGFLTVVCMTAACSSDAAEPESSAPATNAAPSPSTTARPATTTSAPDDTEPDDTEPADIGPADTGPADTEPDDTQPDEPAAAANGGVVTITGDVEYTNTFFTAGVAEPLVILEDQTGFITRDRNYVFPVESQVLGQITSDFFTSPFSYSVTLPQQPNAPLNDVDNDDEEDTGVMVYAVAFWTNTWGDPYLEERDLGGGGWSSAYASTHVTDASDKYLEVIGGKYVVFAPDDEQEFPTGFGDDELLFTEDDPVGALPEGWSVIDLDQEPFGIDRSPEPTVDLIEPESTALDDFSGLSYTEAFDEMLDKFRREYAFTEYKDIDWDAMEEQFRPRFEEAEEAEDSHAYALAIRDFVWAIPDVHVGFDQSLLEEDFVRETSGGLGMAISETDAGEVVVTYVLEDGPAAQAGIQVGAIVTEFDAQPIGDLVAANVPWSSPFSNPEARRSQQVRYVTRFPLDHPPVAVTFTNPGQPAQTVPVPVVDERESLNASSVFANEPPTSLPVEFEILPSGVGYLKITSFFDNSLLTIQLWERAITFLNDNQVPAVVIDMRVNGGGNGFLADQMAAYFFEERTPTGTTSQYDEVTDDFFTDPGSEAEMIPPPEALQYGGDIAVIVGPGCVSACEFFSYDLTIEDRATIVGHQPTAGGGGSVEQFLMPENLSVQLTIGRAVDPEGNIHIEGTGIVPTVDVPVTVESLLATANGTDVLLAAAAAELAGPQ
jgi:C-terminal processing protease CtpA/Prc